MTFDAQILRIRFSALIAVVMMLPSCRQKNSVEIHRPHDPWAIRSVLDKQPRMLTIALDHDCYIAYDLANCKLTKVWKGGVLLQGTAYTDKKNIQPVSWGQSYTNDLQNNWKADVNGTVVDLHLINKGYAFRNNQIYLKYLLIMPSHDTIHIEERPEFVKDNNGHPGLERTFTVANIPSNTQIRLTSSKNSFTLNRNTSSRLVTWFDPLPEQSPPSEDMAYDHKGRYWMEKSDCFTCHDVDKNNVGPSFRAVAERYKDEEKPASHLISKIREGGSGVWGSSVMTPHMNLTEADVYTMVDYIMSLKPRENDKPELSPPRKDADPVYIKPGFGAALEIVHPGYQLQTIHKANFTPRVGGLAFMPDGTLLVSTWDSIGGVYALKGVETGDTNRITVKRIASGLAEPLGLQVVNGEIYVLQKQELTHLIDHDGDGVTDEYEAVCNSWGVTGDFHEFAFGLVYKDGYFYATLSMAMRLMSYEKELQDRGRTIKISPDGSYQWINYGLRTPNGIGIGPDDEIFETDNQGEWVPANKVIHVKQGEYHGMRWGFLDSSKQPPAVAMPAIWLPENEIGNSPSEPVLIRDGIYKDQLLHGDVTFGGLQRDFLEKINGEFQGAVFRFSRGLEAGINRMRFGPDGALYIGGVGMQGGGWSWNNKLFGLQRLKANGKEVFDMLAVRAKPKGFEIEFTQPLAASFVPKTGSIMIAQWWYLPTANYGGPKKDYQTLTVTSLHLSADRKHLYIEVPRLKEQHDVYIRLDSSFKNEKAESLWASEAWYTLNNIPK